MKVNKKILVIVCLLLCSILLLMLFSINHREKETEKNISKKVVLTRDGYKTEMNVEKFIPCVLFAQIDLDSDIEAIKAQAVIVRTYITYMMKNKDTINASELELPYYTYEEMMSKWNSQSKVEKSKGIKGVFQNIIGVNNNEYFVKKMNIVNQVMDETALKVMKSKGEVVLPLFHEISGGTTRNGMEVFGENYGYLLAIKCEDDYNSGEYKNIYNFTPEEFSTQMAENKIVIYDANKIEKDISKIGADEIIQNIQINQDSSEYVYSIKLWETIVSGEDFASALNINSSNFTIENIDNKIRITTKGKGHGFGLSMNQARAFAQQGLKYEEILKKFYDVSITEY